MKLAQVENGVIINIAEFEADNVPDWASTWIDATNLDVGMTDDGQGGYIRDPAILQANEERQIRKSKKREISAYALSLIQAQMPTIEKFRELELLKKYQRAFTLSVTGELVKDIYVYAQTKLDQADTAPIAQVEAYDPTTDTKWPRG